VVTSIFDAVNAFTQNCASYSFTFATIDALTKALQGQPIADDDWKSPVHSGQDVGCHSGSEAAWCDHGR
jgi:hypothetical protein